MAATIAKALSTAMQPTRSLLFSTAATANSSNTTASSSSSNSSSSTSSNLNSANTTASTASPLPSSASAAPFASAKQALSSRASKLRSRLPSRRVSLLLAAALGLLAAKRYDQVESERRVRTYADKAREIGAQPVSLDWRPRRVRVCVAPEEAERGKVFKPRRHFRDFCKVRKRGWCERASNFTFFLSFALFSTLSFSHFIRTRIFSLLSPTFLIGSRAAGV